jgi:hypothetical protein
VDDFTYFHLCNHRLEKEKSDGEVRNITVFSGRDSIDTVINGAILLEIQEVRAVEYDPNDVEILDFFYDNRQREQTYDDEDPGEAYYDEAEQYYVEYSKYFLPNAKISEPLPPGFYQPTLHNRIKWLVKPPKKYQVTAKVRFTHVSYINYPPNECPVCGGKGWFVDIIDKDGKFQTPAGVEKIAQRVVKNLLTEVGTQIFDPTYGTRVKRDLMLDSTNDDEQLFNLIRLAVSDVEDVYLSDQQERILEIPPEEILISLNTENVFRSSQNPTLIIVQIQIVTQTEEQLFRIGF